MTEDTRLPELQEDVAVHSAGLRATARWDRLEQLAKIVSLVAVPIVLAVVGALIQHQLGQRSLNQEYVKLAVSILTTHGGDVDPAIRSWAVDLLNDTSPTKFDRVVLDRLKTGEVSLPALQRLLGSRRDEGSVALSPDGRFAVTGHEDGAARLWDVDSGVMLRRFEGHDAAVTGVAFSPDGALLGTGSLDGTARLWKVSTGELLQMVRVGAEVQGVAFNPAGSALVTRASGLLSYWPIGEDNEEPFMIETPTMTLGVEG